MKVETGAESSSRPDDVVVGLSLLLQGHGQSLQLLDGVFSHDHEGLRVAGGAALKTPGRKRESMK